MIFYLYVGVTSNSIIAGNNLIFVLELMLFEDVLINHLYHNHEKEMKKIDVEINSLNNNHNEKENQIY